MGDAESQTPKSRRAKPDRSQDGGEMVDSAWKGFSSAFNSIMERDLAKPSAPVLSETLVEKELSDKKAEYKEKKQLAEKERSLKDQGHALPDTMDKAIELQLRRVATKGVVRLFNTVKEFQMRGFNEDESLRRGKVPIKKRRDKMAESAKDKFEKLWS